MTRRGGLPPIPLASPNQCAVVCGSSSVSTDIIWPEDLLALESPGRKVPVLRLIAVRPLKWTFVEVTRELIPAWSNGPYQGRVVRHGGSVGQWVRIQGKWQCGFLSPECGATWNSRLAAGRQAKLIFTRLCDLNCLRDGLACLNSNIQW